MIFFVLSIISILFFNLFFFCSVCRGAYFDKIRSEDFVIKCSIYFGLGYAIDSLRGFFFIKENHFQYIMKTGLRVIVELSM